MTPVPMDENRITYFAETDARNKRLKFGIKAKDRTKHVYVIGKTGMGKSTLLENMAVQDIQGGEGMCFIDPHGKTADLLLEYVPKERVRDVIYIAPFDVEFPISFNVLEHVDRDKRHLVVSGLMSTFKKIWVDAWSARMEYILTNTLLALLEAPGSTLLGVNRMLSDKEYRKEIVSHVQDPSVKSFWVKEFASYTERQAAEAVPAIQNKVGQFTANPLIRNMIGQAKSSFDFREAMDQRKIVIINLSKGKIGDENMKLLGGLLVTKIYLAAMSRADVPDRVMKMLPNFYLHVDEFQNFANASFADILSEARKYKLNLTIAHQYVEQMDELVRPAVFGNVGTMIVFRVGATDAEVFEKEFAPQFTIEDLVNIGAYQIYLKLMIDGLSSVPFSARTLNAIPHPDTSYIKEIIAASREQFAQPRDLVEAEVVKFHESTPMIKKAPVATSVSAGSIAPVSLNGSPVPSTAAPINISSKSTTTTVTTNTTTSSMSNVPPGIPKSQTSSISTPVSKPQPSSFSSKNVQPPKPIVATISPKPVSSSVIQNSTNPDPILSHAPIPVTIPKTESASSISQTHKPFNAALSDVLKAVTHAPATTPIQAPVAPIQQPVKSMSLSSLIEKPSTRQDPKVPSRQNVSDLKSALAAAMGKVPSKESSSQTVPQGKPIENNSNSQVSPSGTSKKETPKIYSTGDSPKEVSEEVLKRVLNID